MKIVHRLFLAAGLLVSLPAAANDKLYKDLGGRANIAVFMGDAVDRWVADPRIAYTFDNINLDRLKERLADQICELAGGPCHYTGRNMYLSHKGLFLNEHDFNALVEDTQDAMDKAGIRFGTQNRLLALLAPMKRDIVTK
jgi:hemoglobin